MRKKLSSILALVIITVFTAGCGSSVNGDHIGLSFRKNGSVVHTIVEDFAESYYDLEELKAGIEEQITEYNNTSGADSIELISANAKDGIVTVVMNFSKAAHYTGFYKKALFCGTIQDAYKAGYDLNITLTSTENSDTKIGRSQILEMSDRHIIIVREAVPIRPYAEILYTSGDVTVSEDRREATPGNSENLSYIIFK